MSMMLVAGRFMNWWVPVVHLVPTVSGNLHRPGVTSSRRYVLDGSSESESELCWVCKSLIIQALQAVIFRWFWWSAALKEWTFVSWFHHNCTHTHIISKTINFHNVNKANADWWGFAESFAETAHPSRPSCRFAAEAGKAAGKAGLVSEGQRTHRHTN